MPSRTGTLLLLNASNTLESEENQNVTVSRGISSAVAVLTLAVLSIPARAAIPPAPGVVNYIEGTASIDGQPITSKDIGQVEVRQNQTLATGQGKVEMLLTPGVLLRLGPNSQVRM